MRLREYDKTGLFRTLTNKTYKNIRKKEGVKRPLNTTFLLALL